MAIKCLTACVNPGSIPSAPANLITNNKKKRTNPNIIISASEDAAGSTIIINNSTNDAALNNTNVLDFNMISLLPFNNNNVISSGVAN